MSTTPKALQPHTLIGDRFRIVSLVAMGGQSVVYRGVDTQSGNGVAVKLMRGSDDVDEADARRQFEREYEVLAGGGPGLPAAVAVLEHEGQPVVVEEWIEGQTLEHEGTHVAVDRAARLMIQVLATLEHLHARTPPVIVRDVKPSNVIVRGDDTWIIDLSSARSLRGPRDTMALGTPGFAAPEQHSGVSEIRSDLFSVGAVLSYLLTGEDGTLTKLPCRPARTRPDVPPALDAVVRKATQFEAEKRYHSAREMAEDLRQALARPWTAPAPGAQPPAAATPGRGKRRRSGGQILPSAPSTAVLPSGTPPPPVASPSVYPWSGAGGLASAAPTVVPPSAFGVFVVATGVGITLRLCIWCATSLEMGAWGFMFMCPWLFSTGFWAFAGQSWPSRRWAWMAGMIWVWFVSFSSVAPPVAEAPTPPTPAPVRTSVVPQVAAGALVAGDAGRPGVATLPRPRNVLWVGRLLGMGQAEYPRALDRLLRVDSFLVGCSFSRPGLVVVDPNGLAVPVAVPGKRLVDVVRAVVRNAPPSVVAATDRGISVVDLASGQVTDGADLKDGQRVRSLVSLWRTVRDGLEPSPPLVAALHENGLVTLYDRRLAIMAQATVPPQVKSDATARLYGAGTRLVVGGRSGFWVSPLPLKEWTRLDRLPPDARPVSDPQGAGLYFVAPREIAYLQGDGTLRVAAAERDYEPRILEAPLALAYRHCTTDTNYGRQFLVADSSTLNSYQAATQGLPAHRQERQNWSPRFFWYRALQGEFIAMAVDQTPGAPVGVLSQVGGELHWVAWSSFGQKIHEVTLPLSGVSSRALDAVITDQGIAVLYPEGLVLLKP